MPTIGGLDDDENTAIIAHFVTSKSTKASRTRPNDYRALHVKGDRRARCRKIRLEWTSGYGCGSHAGRLARRGRHDQGDQEVP